MTIFLLVAVIVGLAVAATFMARGGGQRWRASPPAEAACQRQLVH